VVSGSWFEAARRREGRRFEVPGLGNVDAQSKGRRGRYSAWISRSIDAVESDAIRPSDGRSRSLVRGRW